MATEDIFIMGVIKLIDPVTNVPIEEYGPKINLSEFIRYIKFPQRILKGKVTARNVNRYGAPKSLPRTTSINDFSHSNGIASDNSAAQNHRSQEAVQAKSFTQNPPAFIPSTNLKVSSDEAAMLKQALAMSLGESVSCDSNIAATPEKPIEPYFNDMSENEQLALALKMSMQQPLINEHAFSVPV